MELQKSFIISAIILKITFESNVARGYLNYSFVKYILLAFSHRSFDELYPFV